MKVHAVYLVKNEADVIEQSLRAAVQWCDRIYVYDNGSDDGTWERVGELALRYRHIVPFKQDAQPFRDGIRREVTERYAANASRGDWWCLLDADEFPIDDPREFLARVPKRYRAVCKQDFAYRFTDRDLAAYRQDPLRYADEVPVEEKCHWYTFGASEGRFFRHRGAGTREVRGMWEDSFLIYPRRIRFRHFQYRSPQQIQKRIDTRLDAIRRGIFVHEKRLNWVPGATHKVLKPGVPLPGEVPECWEERVVDSSKLFYDAYDGTFPGQDHDEPWTPPQRPSRIPALLRRAASLQFLYPLLQNFVDVS